jgi:hypothetical protein
MRFHITTEAGTAASIKEAASLPYLYCNSRATFLQKEALFWLQIVLFCALGKNYAVLF